MHKLQVT